MNPDLQKAIDFAKKNPDDPRAEELRRRMEAGMFNKELQAAGMKTFEVKPPPPTAYQQPAQEQVTEEVTVEAPEEPGLLSKLKGRYDEAVGGAAEQIPKALTGDSVAKVRSITRPLGALGRGAGDIAESALKTGYDLLPDVVTDKVEEVTKPTLEAATPAISAVLGKFNKFKESNPQAAQDIEDLLGISELVGAGLAAKPIKAGVTPVLKAAGEAVEEGLEKRAVAKGIKADDKLMEYVTPKPAELTPTEYEKALSRGRVTPKTATQTAQYVLPESERVVAMKYKDVINKDPVQTSINIFEKVNGLDQDVGRFLEANNGIFNKGELKNRLADGISDIDDLSVDAGRVATAKDALVTNFVSKLKKNDMKSLWEARKEFDRDIESAFRGAPSLQKEMKIAFRNSIQDFISESTPDQIYKDYMKDMSNLLRLQETVATRAAKERGLDAIEAWFKNHPTTKKAVGWGAAGLGVGGGASILLN